MRGRRLPPARAARFVAWGNACLQGWASLDDAAEHIQGADRRHRVDGLRGGDDVSLAVALGRLAGGGVTGLRLVLPIPGDVSSLPGPLDFNVEALAAGEAVVCVGADAGLVPTVVRSVGAGEGADAVRWRLSTTDGASARGTGVAEAEQGLASAVREAATALAALDVAGAAPETARELATLRAGLLDPRLPSGYDRRAVELLGRACRIAALVALAGEEEGSAVSAASMSARRAELVRLAGAARHAVEAAHNSPLEPSPDDGTGRASR